MNKYKIYKELVNQSTWILLLFSTITLGIYTAYYIFMQTNKINNYLDTNEKLSNILVTFIILSSFVSTFSYFFGIVLETNMFDDIESVFSYIFIILTIIWGLKVRSVMNRLMNYHKDDNEWFSILWTVLFTPYYFNYKITCMCNKIKSAKIKDFM